MLRLLKINDIYSIMVIIDKITRMTHLIPCSKTMTALQTAQYYKDYVGKIYGIQKFIYTDRGTQFTSNVWKNLWRLFGIGLRYNTAFHPQTHKALLRG